MPRHEMRTTAALLIFVWSSAMPAEPSSISIERSGCYGTCPAYVMTVDAEGSYVWEGRRYVKRLGVQRGRFDPKVFVRALKALQGVQYMKFRDSYVSRELDGCKEEWTDNPSVSIRIETTAGSKTIRHYLGCRGFPGETELLKVEDQLDEIFGTQTWVSAKP